MMLPKNRYSEPTSEPEVTAYKIKWQEGYDRSVDEYSWLMGKIQGMVQEVEGKWWQGAHEIGEEDKSALKRLSVFFHHNHRGSRNVLKDAHRTDKKVWWGKDNQVFTTRTTQKVVYKESNHPTSPSGVLYLRRKYSILKRYLGDCIPQARFVLGEVNHSTKIARWATLVDKPQLSSITLQRKIDGPNLQKLSKEAKKDPVLLSSLGKNHRKYILLKMFIRTAAEQLGLSPDTVDVKMDLGPLSNIDQLDTQDASSIRKNLISPNIMYDGKQVYFIDMDTGEWSDDKEKLYQYLMMPETVQRWDEILWSFWLAD